VTLRTTVDRSVTSSTATLPLDSAWICISTECTF